MTPPRLARYLADSSLPTLVSSPAELFQTAAGLPLLLTLAVLLLHLACCGLQAACGSANEADADDDAKARAPREEVREAIATQSGSQRRLAADSPLIAQADES